jgi:hypothetical protein
MLLNRKNNKQKTTYEKKANHGIQTAKVEGVKIAKDKNENNYLILSLECETGNFNKFYLRPYMSQFMSYDAESIETTLSAYWETCDKIVDELYRFIQMFDKSEIDAEGYIEYNFAKEYKTFLEGLGRKMKIEVTEANLADFGFVKSKRKVTKQKFSNNEDYTAYISRIEGVEKNTWFEDTGLPAYAYADSVGESIPDYENVDFWNAFFVFVTEYFGELQKTERLLKEFDVKLIRIESPEYEKDAESKVLKIDNKKVIKTMYYPVATPESTWFKLPENKKFELKMSKKELEIISIFEAQKEIATTDGNELPDTLGLPF